MYTPKYITTISVTRRKASPAPRARESELRTWFLWVPSAPRLRFRSCGAHQQKCWSCHIPGSLEHCAGRWLERLQEL